MQQISFCGRAPPANPLGEVTGGCSPDLLAWIKRHTSKGRRREGKGEERGQRRKGNGKRGEKTKTGAERRGREGRREERTGGEKEGKKGGMEAEGAPF